MFDPFRDFEHAGYLRNRYGEKDPEIVRELEHQVFLAGLTEATAYAARRKRLVYEDFLTVHRILFAAIYPWAGRDRAETAPEIAVSKAGTLFCHPLDARRAIDAGLRIGSDKAKMRQSPGEVMGLFAYGHPFLDGNGRTMLVIHGELCHRAGFSIEWHRTSKTEYLQALSREVAAPGQGILDSYLRPFIETRKERSLWVAALAGMPGLGGQTVEDTIEGPNSDASVAQRYREFEQQRATARARLSSTTS
jgi:cell filamentation protein